MCAAFYSHTRASFSWAFGFAEWVAGLIVALDRYYLISAPCYRLYLARSDAVLGDLGVYQKALALGFLVLC